MERALLGLALLSWQQVLGEPLRQIQALDVNPDAISNIELLIPLLVDEPSERRESERYEEDSRSDGDEPYSPIPAYAFELDDAFAVEETAPPLPPPAPAASLGSRKKDLSRQQYYDRLHRPRSLYLQDSAESDEQERAEQDMWRACSRLARARRGVARELLLHICAELLEAGAPPPAPAAPRSPRAPRARRDYVPLGDNPDMVQRYMNMARKKPQLPWNSDRY